MSDSSISPVSPVNPASLTDEQVDSLTKRREERVRPVVQEIKKLLVNKDILLSDTYYIEQLVNQELKLIVSSIVFQHFHEIFNQLQRDLELSVGMAHDVLWGKDTDSVGFKDVDAALSKGVKGAKIPEGFLIR